MTTEETPPDERHIIPTRYRDKTPSTLSYPIGAELLSEALAGTPQYEKLRLWFSHFNRKSEPKTLEALVARGRPAEVVSISFYSAASGMSSEPGGEWFIRIRSVPRDFKSLVREGLLSHGLPAIRNWLMRDKPEIVEELAGGVRVFLNPADKSIFTESHVRFDQVRIKPTRHQAEPDAG